MRFIKRTTLIMALALIVPILAACGGSTPTTPPAQPTQPSAAQPSVAPTEATANTQPTSQPTEAAPTEAAATDTPAPSGADKTVIVAMTQFPDTLFAIESQSLATAQVIQAVQPTCINNLAYDYQAVCFEKVPDFADGDAVIEKVSVDSSYAGSIVINNELITDTSTLTGPIELDQVKVTWKLVDGLTWEDGTPLTAEDFVFAAELYRSPEIKLTTRFVLDRTEKYEAPDAQTLVWYGVPGYEDATYFLNTFGPEPKHVLEGMQPGDIGAGEYANKPLAYGPYKIVENIPQESTTLVANPTYWRAAEGLPRIGNVVFKYLTSEDQILQQMESGEIDVSLSGIGLTVAQAPQLDVMESAGTLKAQYVAGTSWDHLDFGMIRSDGSDPFFSDLKVRQAVAYAINRQEIVDEVMFGKAPIMNSILPEEHWAYPPAGQGLETYVYDPDKAAQLLDEAGWTLGSDGIREKDGRKMSAIQFYTTENNQSRQAVAQVIQENLKQVGIDIELNFVPGTAVLFANGEDGILSNHTFDLALYGFTSSSDPNMSLYLCNQIPSADNDYDGQNNPGYCSEEFDSVALAANAETDREARIPLAVKAQQIVNRDLPTLPLYQKVKVGAARPGVSGFELDSTNQQDTYNIDEWDITE
jgi:peptide/nickel transport system substrate-binding protein